MDEPHFPKSRAPPAVEPAPQATPRPAPRVVRRPEPPSEGPESPGFSREEVRALLATTAAAAPRSRWSRSAWRATSFVAVLLVGWALDALVGFWPSTIATTVLGLALFGWTLRPLWQQRDWQ